MKKGIVFSLLMAYEISSCFAEEKKFQTGWKESGIKDSVSESLSFMVCLRKSKPSSFLTFKLSSDCEG